MTTNIVDKGGNLITAKDVTSKPSDRHFRNAWTLSGKVITEDLATAKTIFKEKIRSVINNSSSLTSDLTKVSSLIVSS